jgi:membrane-associated protein
MLHNFLNLIEPLILIKTLGLIGLFFIIFAESGLFFGFFFPGDSLLFTAGILSVTNNLNIYALLFGSFVFAVLGDSVGYFFGKKIGPRIFKREDSFFFHKKHIERAQNFYTIHGNKTIFLARFIPIVRTFAPIVAGVGQMKYRDFIAYNILGGFVWSFSMILCGYFLGHIIPNIDTYLLPIILVIIIISILPVLFEIIRSKKDHKNL